MTVWEGTTEGRLQALLFYARRGEWALVRDWLDRLEGFDREYYEHALAEAGCPLPEAPSP